jgi:hypothetical protein
MDEMKLYFLRRLTERRVSKRDLGWKLDLIQQRIPVERNEQVLPFGVDPDGVIMIFVFTGSKFNRNLLRHSRSKQATLWEGNLELVRIDRTQKIKP